MLELFNQYRHIRRMKISNTVHIHNNCIDSHFHGLIMKDKGVDPVPLLHSLGEAGMSAMVDIGTHPEDLSRRLQLYESLSSDAPALGFSSGIYPSHAGEKNVDLLLEQLEEQLAGKTVCAVGECGLDYHWDYATPEMQHSLFKNQIKLANKYKKPLIIHNREADKDCLEILDATPAEYGTLIHCFGSDKAFAEACVERDYYISFAGNLSYKKAVPLQQAISCVSANRLLLETDAPYLSPQKVRGFWNHPGHIGYTFEAASEFTGIPLPELIRKVRGNFQRLFGF